MVAYVGRDLDATDRCAACGVCLAADAFADRGEGSEAFFEAGGEVLYELMSDCFMLR